MWRGTLLPLNPTQPPDVPGDDQGGCAGCHGAEEAGGNHGFFLVDPQAQAQGSLYEEAEAAAVSVGRAA